MRKYPCKKEVTAQLLQSRMLEIFGNIRNENHVFISTFSDSLEVSAIVTGKKEISVETTTQPGPNTEREMRIYNKFLEQVTGYTAKERKKLVSKA